MTARAPCLSHVPRVSIVEEHGSRLFQISYTFQYEGEPLAERRGQRFWDEGERMPPRATVFLLSMAAISLVRELGGGLIGNALLACFGLTVDLFHLSVALHLAVTLIGLGVACTFSKGTPDSTAKRHMLLTLVAAMGIGLILSWLSHLVAHTNGLDWLPALVYLLWAWTAAVSDI